MRVVLSGFVLHKLLIITLKTIWKIVEFERANSQEFKNNLPTAINLYSSCSVFSTVNCFEGTDKLEIKLTGMYLSLLYGTK